MRGVTLPLKVMLEEGDVVGTLEPNGSPFVVLLDRQATFLYESELDTVSWWETLSAAAG